LVFAACGLALAAANPQAAKVAEAGKDAWTVFRGDGPQTGVSASKLPAKLAVLWTFKTEDSIEGAVAVRGGVVYVGSMDEHLYAVDFATGKRKWKYKGGPFKASPAMRDGVVYAGDLDGVLHAVGAARGEKRWTFETGAELSAVNFFGNEILFASHDEHLYCLTAQGKRRWKFKTDGPIFGAPAVAGGRTFLVGCDSKMHVLDIARGKEERSVNLDAQTGASAAVGGAHLYVGTMGNAVRAINWKKGAASWTFRPPGRGQGFFSSAAVGDEVVVIGSRDNRVYALDRKTGTQVWSFPTGNRVDSSPVIAGDRVVVGSLDGSLYVLDLASGKERQRLKLDAPISGSPAVVAGRVLIGTQKGTLYCLGAKKG
jgi:outer membrane protein assembly factor BamB